MSSQFAIQNTAQIFRVKFKELFLENFHFLVGAATNDGVKNIFLGTQPFASQLDHVTFCFNGIDGHQLEGRAKVPASAFGLHERLETLVEHFFKTQGNLATQLSIHAAHCFEQPFLISAKLVFCVVAYM